MYVQMRLRHYDCADCGIPCKSTSPNAERCSECAKLRLNQQSRDYQQKALARKRAARQSAAIQT
jgi:hypothetical protein